MVLKPVIDYQSSGVIWRMEIDDQTDSIAIENRNVDEKQVSFSALNLNTGKVHFDGLTNEERWLTGMEAFVNGVLLMHFYQSESIPVHKGLLAIDVLTGQTLWSNYTLAFNNVDQNGIIVYDTRIQPRKLFFVDVESGATLKKEDIKSSNKSENHIIVPEIVEAESLPSALINETPYSNMVHYLDYNDYRIVSLHALTDGQLTQRLFVFDKIFTLVYEDLLNTGIQKIQPESFILHKNRLIYIKNKSRLKVLSL